jgi:hypothetical protein
LNIKPRLISQSGLYSLLELSAEDVIKTVTKVTGFVALTTVYIRPADNASRADQNRVLLKKPCTQSCTQELLACESCLFCRSHPHSMFKHETSNVPATQVDAAKQRTEPEGGEQLTYLRYGHKLPVATSATANPLRGLSSTERKRWKVEEN